MRGHATTHCTGPGSCLNWCGYLHGRVGKKSWSKILKRRADAYVFKFDRVIGGKSLKKNIDCGLSESEFVPVVLFKGYFVDQ